MANAHIAKQGIGIANAYYAPAVVRFKHESIFLALIVLAALMLIGCHSSNHLQQHSSSDEHYLPQFSMQAPVSTQIYVFGIHPLHNPERLHEMFGPLIRDLSTQLPGIAFRLEASRNYASFDKKLYSGKFHFALPNPYQTINATEHGYTVFAKMANDEDFQGIIFARRDGPIKKISDLKGKTMCFPAPTALAATMMPQYFLQSNGIDINADLTIHYVGSQESSIMNVLIGDADAGASWPPPWRALLKERPEIEQELVVLWKTDNLPSNSVMVRKDVPEHVTEMVSRVLCGLHETPDGKTWLSRLELSRFEPATNATYDPVREFVKNFNETVHPMEQ